jgi:hypothetical protein
MSAILGYLKSLFTSSATAVDTAVPVAVGNRTQIVVLLCALLQYAAPYVPAPYNAAVPVLMGILCGSAPVFAAAGLVRKAAGSVA